MAHEAQVWPGTEAVRVVGPRTGTAPVYTYSLTSGRPPVSVVRIERGSLAAADPGHAHSHDFLTIAYFEHGGGSLRLGGRQWPIRSGDVYLVAPGETMGFGDRMDGVDAVEGWGVFFPVEGLGPSVPHALLAWRAHPLLFPFVRGVADGARRLAVPSPQRAAWTLRMRSLDAELRRRDDGYHQAVVAHLTLLLVEISRLPHDSADRHESQLGQEPILAEVFEAIERGFRGRISLRHVAADLSLTPGYLTTIVRRKTGRTVQDWITERRLAEARRLLVQTDLAVADVADRVGYADPSYFVRVFRRAHGATPLRWRQGGRP